VVKYYPLHTFMRKLDIFGAVHRQHGLYIRIRHKLGFNSFPLVLNWSAQKPYTERKCVRYNLLYIGRHDNR
jgi:hypothetical protein